MVAGAAITPVDDEEGITPIKQRKSSTWKGRQQQALKELAEMIKARKKIPLQRALKQAKSLQLHNSPLILDAEEVIAVLEAEERADQTTTQIIDKAKKSEKRVGKVFHPQDKKMQRWDYAMCCCLIFTATVTPFEVAFLETTIDGLFFINRVVDLFFVRDMYVQFNLSYKDAEQGKWITEPAQIRRHYGFSWFPIDFISTIPYDCISLFLKTDSLSNLKVMRTLKLLKLAKLLRMLRSARIFKRLQAVLGITNANAKLIKFLCLMFLVIHWIACLWRMVPTFESAPGDGWINTLIAAGQLETPVCEPTSVVANTPSSSSDLVAECQPSSASLYLRGVEFSLMIMVMGYSTAKPDTDQERGVAIMCMVVAGAAYAYVIGAVCSVVSERDPVAIQYQQTMDLLRSFMDENHLPMSLRFKMQNYFEHIRVLFRDQHHKREILECMTPQLQQEVALFKEGTWIAKVPFFNASNEEERDKFVAAVALKLVPTAFPPNETIYMVGEEADCMYILTRGLVRKKGTMLSKGAFFGEEMIMTDAVRTEETVTLTMVDAAQLFRHDLWSVLGTEEGMIAKTFYQTRELVRKAAIRMSLRKVVLEIGRSVIVLKKDNWAKWGKRYTRMTQTEVDSFKSLMSQRIAEHEEKYGSAEEIKEKMAKRERRDSTSVKDGVAQDILKYWTGRDYSKWGKVSKEKILDMARAKLAKNGIGGAKGGGGFAALLNKAAANTAVEETPGGGPVDAVNELGLGPRQELPDAPVLSAEERAELKPPPNLNDVVGGKLLKPIQTKKDPETEQEIFQEELQLRMQQKLDDKMTEMQDKISANMDAVLNQAVHKFASEMSDLKSMCEEELEKTQQMLHHLTDNQQ